MGARVEVAVEVPGLRVEFSGETALFDEVVRGMLAPVARGAWASGGGALPPPSAEAPLPIPLAVEGPSPARSGPSEAVPFRAPAPRGRAAPEVPPAAAPAASPAAAAAAAVPDRPGFDPAPLYAALARDEGRRAEKDAVLLALVALAAAGKRDATPAEITAHLSSGGFPAAGLHPRPILAKLCHRKGLAAPGLLPGTYRATPAGVTHILRRARGG
jgi:hypothetical protein